MNVDIVVIAYNQRRFIQQALESVFMQQINAKVRLIIADDCSSDGTLELIKEITTSSPFEVVYLPEVDNLGISKNYQRAFESCSGDYIAILEGDDYWCSPHHIRQHIDFLEEHRECSMSMNCFISQDDEAGMFTEMNWGYCQYPHYINVQEQIEQGNKLGNLSACVLRTSCVKKLPNSLFELSIADWMLGIMLSQQGYLAILEDRTSVYRRNPNSKWASMSYNDHIQFKLKRAEEYDAFQNGKYHDYWQSYKSSQLQENKATWKDYCPPFVLLLIKACTPPILKRIIKGRG